jgi:hypothetical protein
MSPGQMPPAWQEVADISADVLQLERSLVARCEALDLPPPPLGSTAPAHLHLDPVGMLAWFKARRNNLYRVGVQTTNRALLRAAWS